MAIRKPCAALCGLTAILLLQPAVAEAAANPPLQIAPIRSHPGGQSYAQWAAEWWQWALQTPASVNPVLDESGEHCHQSQIGRVWFLAGTFGSEPVERTCAIPSGTALFFPLVNDAWFAFLDDPDEERTEEFIRSQADCGEPADHLLLTLNGRPATGLNRFFVESVIFDVQLPPDNVFGATEEVVLELRLSPSVSAGYHVFLHPLPPGEYTLHWEASWCEIEQDITYKLSVLRGRSGR